MDIPQLVQQMGAVGVIVALWMLTWRWVLTRLSDDLGEIRESLARIEKEIGKK